MKTEESLHNSMNARYKQAKKNAELIIHTLNNLGSDSHAEKMPTLRKAISLLSQQVSEYNAYFNALYTE